ncbi:MAG: flagellar filament capping protein FliD [Burkholderiales bacterium]|nr:flagellar filament capping protein FliD [Burkholderiales bacterium]
MATMSSPGIGSNLDVKSIVTQLVALEKKPLEKLQLAAATVQTKISVFGQIKSLVSALSDAVSRLSSVTGWNGVSASSSDTSAVTASAIGGTQPTSFSVEVQSLAKAQSSYTMPLLPVGGAVGAGSLRLEIGQWAGAVFTPGSGTPVDLTIGATDTVADIASKINGANAGVTATVLSDASGDRLLLSGKNTGLAAGFQLSVTSDIDGDPADALGLSRLVNGSVTNQAATNATATINGIGVSSATNVFANSVAGVTFTAVKQTTAPVTLTIAKDTSTVKKNIEDFVKAYNEINGVLNEATKYDQATKTGGLLQGDSTTLALQSALRAAVQSVSTGSSMYSRLSDIGVSALRGGNLEVDSTKLGKALGNMDELKALFSSTTPGNAEGIAVRLKGLTKTLLASDGYFKTKDDNLKRSLDNNAKDQVRVNEKASRMEAALNRRYSALDVQLTSLNSLNTYLTQQITQWNRSTS